MIIPYDVYTFLLRVVHQMSISQSSEAIGNFHPFVEYISMYTLWLWSIEHAVYMQIAFNRMRDSENGMSRYDGWMSREWRSGSRSSGRKSGRKSGKKEFFPFYFRFESDVSSGYKYFFRSPALSPTIQIRFFHCIIRSEQDTNWFHWSTYQRKYTGRRFASNPLYSIVSERYSWRIHKSTRISILQLCLNHFLFNFTSLIWACTLYSCVCVLCLLSIASHSFVHLCSFLWAFN